MSLGPGDTLVPKAVSVAIAIGLLASTSFGQRTKVLAPHKPIPPKAAKQIKGLTPAEQRSMVGGLWMTDANFKSSIYLRNGVETDPITVTPILHLSNGAKYTLGEVKVEPAGVAIIDINDGLAKLGISSFATLSGYVELQYLWGWDPFCATIRNVDTANSLIFTYALRPTALPPIMTHAVHPERMTPAQTVEGMWWKQESNVTGFVSIANLSGEPAKTLIQVTDEQSKPIAQHNVTVSPHGMKLVNLTELQTTSALLGGVRVTSTATMDNLVVNGGLKDSSVGYSVKLPFSHELIESPQPIETQATLAELDLMTGPAPAMMALPGNTAFTPYSVLRNISNEPISLAPTLWWMEAGAPQSAQLPLITLAPWQTRSLDMKFLLLSSGLANFNGSFNLVFNGQVKAGSLLMTSGSVDQSNNYVFEVVPRFVGESASKSLQYWSTGNGDDTMVTIWNPADEAQDFAFTLFFSGGHYTLPLHLEPRATRNFNVSEIIQNQVPDAEGNIIPASIHEGGAKIAGSIAEHQHILVAIDSGTYNVRKATCSSGCQECDGYTTASLIDGSFDMAVGGTHQQTFTLTYGSGSQINFNGQSSWSSNQTSVATVAGGLVRGVSAGSATISALVQNVPVQVGQFCGGGSCPITSFNDGSGGTVFKFVVQGNPYIFVGSDSNIVSANSFFATDGAGGSPKPTGGTVSASSSDSSDSFQITQGNNPVVKVTTQDQSTSNLDRTLTFTYTVSGSGSTSQQMTVTARKFAYLTNNNPSNLCTLGHGTDRTYTYTVYTEPDKTALNSDSGPSGTPATETFSPALTCNTVTGSGSLDPNAQFTDHVSSACSSQPLTCSQTSTQTLRVGGYSVRTNTLTWTSTGVTYTSNGPTQ